MFRKYLPLWTGVLVLAGLAGLPGQAHAQRGRGFARPGMFPPINRFALDPRLRARALEVDRLLLEQRRRTLELAIERRRTAPRFRSNLDRQLLDSEIRERQLLLNRRLLTPFASGF
jgi:hypothetical protein